MDGTLICTNNLSQNGPGSNGNEEVLYIFKGPGLEPNYQIQFSVISRTLIERIFSSKEMQLMNSTANWAFQTFGEKDFLHVNKRLLKVH